VAVVLEPTDGRVAALGRPVDADIRRDVFLEREVESRQVAFGGHTDLVHAGALHHLGQSAPIHGPKLILHIRKLLLKTLLAELEVPGMSRGGPDLIDREARTIGPDI
jgi:hypothetical protein